MDPGFVVDMVRCVSVLTVLMGRYYRVYDDKEPVYSITKAHAPPPEKLRLLQVLTEQIM
jgi:hypothetical protein